MATPTSSLLYRRKTLLAKIEAVAGTDPNPTAAANSIQTIGLDVIVQEAETVDIPRDRSELGHIPQAQLSLRSRARFGISIAGSGVAGTATKYVPLLKACGLAEAAAAADGAAVAWAAGAPIALYDTRTEGAKQYEAIQKHQSADANKPTSPDGSQYWRARHELPARRELTPASALSTLWLQTNLDGVKHEIGAARGTFTLTLESGSMPAFAFDFAGEYQKPEADAAPTLDHSGWEEPIPVSQENSPIARLGTLDVVVNSFVFDIANDLQFINDIGRSETVLANRLPGGRIRFEMFKPTDEDGVTYDSNLWGAIQALAKDRLRIRHGKTAGNIVEWYAPNVQLGEPTIVESQGRYMIEAGFRVLAAGGDDFVMRTF